MMVVVLGLASGASAQTEYDIVRTTSRWGLYFGLDRDTLPSFASTGGLVKFGVPVTTFGPFASLESRTRLQDSGDQPVKDLFLSLVGGAGFARSDGENVLQFLGGVRVGHIFERNWGLYSELLFGVIHFPGENDFTVQPGVGVVKPIPGRAISVVLDATFPSIFFSGIRETGFGFSAGLALPFGGLN
jgi:hypothetical protein